MEQRVRVGLGNFILIGVLERLGHQLGEVLDL